MFDKIPPLQRVPRIEDLPYSSSPPISFVYRSTATLSAGIYTWADTPALCINDRRLISNALYFIRTINLSADIAQADFVANIVTVPQFQLYLQSKQNAAIFRDYIYMADFLQNWIFRQSFDTTTRDDHVLCGFAKGKLGQNANLIGKSSITLTAILSAQEITDSAFIKIFKEQFPGGVV